MSFKKKFEAKVSTAWEAWFKNLSHQDRQMMETILDDFDARQREEEERVLNTPSDLVERGRQIRYGI